MSGRLTQTLIMVFLMILSLVLEAQTKTDPKNNDPLAKFRKNLLTKCEDGIAAACYQYGQSIADSEIAEERKKSNFYVRRACMMAYAPACGREASYSDAGKDRAPTAKGCFTPEVFANLNLSPSTTKSGQPGQKMQDVNKLPMFAAAGVKSGDVILKVNGKNFEAPSQIADGLDSGRMDLEIERNGQTMPLTVNCSP